MDPRNAPRRPNTRRNLFPTASSRSGPNAPSMSSNSSLSTLIIAGDGDDGKDELVKTDSNGEYIMNGPAMNVPALDEFNFKIFSDHEIVERTPEQDNQMIALYGKHNAHFEQEAVLAEIKVALRSSLNRIVQSLEDDRWMFEGGKKSRM